MSKTYNILVDNNHIGTTQLENADAPMGIAYGQIIFLNISSGYTFFKSYCLKNKIDFTDYAEDMLISTHDIPNLQVL
ncbi:MAG: hypothetical protein ACXVJG_22605, partial [Mucilaginibacter sp.]